MVSNYQPYQPYQPRYRSDFYRWREKIAEERQQRLIERLRRLGQSGLLGTPVQAQPTPTTTVTSPLLQRLQEMLAQGQTQPQAEEKGGSMPVLGGLGSLIRKGQHAVEPVAGPVLEKAGDVLGPVGKGYRKLEREGMEPLAGRVGLIGEGATDIIGAAARGVTHPLPTQWPENFRRAGRALVRAGEKTGKAVSMTTEEARAEYEKQPGLEQVVTRTVTDPTSYLGWGILKRAGLKAAERPGVLAAITRGLGRGEEKFITATNFPFKVAGKPLAAAWRSNLGLGARQPTEFTAAKAGRSVWDDFRVLSDRVGAQTGDSFRTGDKFLTARVLQQAKGSGEFQDISQLLMDIADSNPNGYAGFVERLGRMAPRDAADLLNKRASQLMRSGIEKEVADRRLGYIRQFGVDLARAAGKELPEEVARPSILQTLRLAGKAAGTKEGVGVLFSNRARRALSAYTLDGLDPVYQLAWRRALEPWFVRPMTNAILSFSGFGAFNAGEGMVRQLAGQENPAMVGADEMMDVFAGNHAAELAGIMREGERSVGGAAGVEKAMGKGNILGTIGKYLGGWSVDLSRRADALQRGGYAVARTRTRFADELRQLGIDQHGGLRELVDFTNKNLPPELESMRKFVNMRVATAAGQGPDAVRAIIKYVNAPAVNRKAALALLSKYSDFSPSVLRVYDDAVRVGGLGRRPDQIFDEMAAGQRVIDESTPEAIGVRVNDMIDHLKERPLKTKLEIQGAIDEAHALENSTAAFERDSTDRYFETLGGLPEGFRAQEGAAAAKQWRSELQRGREAVEDGFQKVIAGVDRYSREQGGSGLSSRAIELSKNVSELRLQRHARLVGESNEFWATQAALGKRVDPADVFEMRMRLSAISDDYSRQIGEALTQFEQAVRRAQTRGVPATVAAQKRYEKAAKGLKPPAEPAAPAPETVGRMRMTEEGDLLREDMFATEAELQGYREGQGALFEKGATPEEIDRLTAERQRQAGRAAEKAARPEAAPTVDELEGRVQAFDAEVLRLKRHEMELQIYLNSDNTSHMYASTRRVSRPRGRKGIQALGMGKPQMTQVDQVTVSDRVAMQLKERGLHVEFDKRRGVWWADFEDEVWGADDWMTQAFGERAGQQGYSFDDAGSLLKEAEAKKRELGSVQAELKAALRERERVHGVVALGKEAERVTVESPITAAQSALRAKITELEGTFDQLIAEAQAGRVPLGYEEIEQRVQEMWAEADDALRHLQALQVAENGGNVLGIDNTAAQLKDSLLELYRTRSTRFEQFKADALETLRKPPMTPEQEEALRGYLEGAAQVVERMPADTQTAVRDAYQRAVDGAVQDLKREFVNYDDRNVVDYVLQHIFPFWTYESRRWPYIARQLATKPLVARTVGPMIGNPEAGQVEIPGTGMQVGLFRGMVFGGVRRFPVGPGAERLFFPAREEGALGTIQHGEDALGSLGFYFGPQITFPLALARGEFGEALPAPASTVLDVATAAGVPGAAALQQRYFQDPFLERDINQVLLSRGQVPSEVRTLADQGDEEAQGQLASARREASLRQAVSTQTSVTRFRPEKIEGMRQARYEAAVAAGVPEDQAKHDLERRRNPITATDDEGRYVLPYEKRIAAYEQAAQIAGVQVEEIHAISELSEPLRTGKQQELTRQRHVYQMEGDRIDAAYGEQMDKIETAFIPGVNGKEIRDLISQLDDETWGRRQQLSDPHGPYGQYVATFSDPEKMQRENRLSVIYNYYREAINDPSLTDDLGRYDYQQRDDIDEKFKQRYGADVFEAIQERLHKNEHPLKRELRLDREKLDDYWNLEDQLWERATATMPQLQGMGFRKYQEAVQEQALAQGIDPQMHPGWKLVDAVQQVLSEVRELYRRRHPDVNTILIKWGYAGTAASTEAQSLFQQQYGYQPRMAANVR